jgi:prophage regulatory protein
MSVEQSTSNIPAAPNNSLLMTIKEVMATTGMGRSTIYRYGDIGRMPKRVPGLDGEMARWRRSEIEEWVAGGCKPVGKK